MHLHVKFPRMHEMPIFTGIPVPTGKLSLFAYYLWLKWANFNVRMGCQFSQRDAHIYCENWHPDAYFYAKIVIRDAYIWGCQYSLFKIFTFFFKETGLCNSKGHKKIATYTKD